MAGPAGWLWGAHLKPFTESTLHRPQQVPAVLLLLRLRLARQLGPRKSPLCGGLAGLHIRVISSSMLQVAMCSGPYPRPLQVGTPWEPAPLPCGELSSLPAPCPPPALSFYLAHASWVPKSDKNTCA